MVDLFAKFTETKVQNLAKAAEELGIEEEIVHKIRSWNAAMIPELEKGTDPATSPDDFQVLCHGDLWLNNQMFRYDADNNVSDVIFVSLTKLIDDITHFLLVESILTMILHDFLYRSIFNYHSGIDRTPICSTFSPHRSSLKCYWSTTITLSSITMTVWSPP